MCHILNLPNFAHRFFNKNSYSNYDENKIYISLPVFFDLYGSPCPDFYDAKEVDSIFAPCPVIKESNKNYDLQGRRLSGKPSRGVYIENGKKRVAK